jgi:ABC-type sugar transport system substrate-binding protein
MRAATVRLVNDAADDHPAESVTIVFIPKSKGIPYYESMYPEFERAAKDTGATLRVAGPAKTDATSQISIIKDQVQQGVDVILLAPNSADALNPSSTPPAPRA